jgi:predicted O-methyltransferase YrrM
MQDWINSLYQDPSMTQMGHAQSAEDLNLGLGWIYYGLARAMRPRNAVVIGSYRGFVPLVIGKALQDNGGGDVTFIDPSLVDDFWANRSEVEAHFARHGVHNVQHYRLTTQEFTATTAYRELKDVGLLFVDGYHSEEQAMFDHEAFLPKMSEDSAALFHDSVRERLTRIYGEDKAYTHTVCRYMQALKGDPRFEVVNFPFGDGLTLVKPALRVAEVACR